MFWYFFVKSLSVKGIEIVNRLGIFYFEGYNDGFLVSVEIVIIRDFKLGW